MKFLNQTNQLKQLKQIFYLFHLLKRKNISKGICLLLFPIMMFQNCYLNPFVYDLLNPIEKEDQTAALSLLGLVPSSFGITGQLMSNGVAVSGASIRISGSTETSASSTTDSSGRFRLIGPTGTISLVVDHMGTIFKIELSVTPPNVTVLSIENSGYSLLNLEVYPSSSESPTYLDLTLSIPYEGLIIDNSNYVATVSPGFTFYFSEEIELPSDYDLWRDQNFLISPSLGFNSVSIGSNQVIIQVNSGTYISQTDYYLTLLPGIRATSGKSLKTTLIRFRIGALAL